MSDVSRAVEEIWRDAKKEIALMLESFEKCFGTSRRPIKMLVDYMVGPESKLYRVLFVDLDLDL